MTGQSEVSALAAVVNNLPTETDAPRSCPADSAGAGIWLDFRPARAGAPDFLVDASVAGCADTGVSVGGAAQPDLNGAPVGQIDRILQVDWTVTSQSSGAMAR
ncbi:MAG TPA: hypothetical protein VGX23_22155 [Actinocrinis sp.]|nr:hypothetical protein [Actinocrinis sp.]